MEHLGSIAQNFGPSLGFLQFAYVSGTICGAQVSAMDSIDNIYIYNHIYIEIVAL